MKFEDKLEYRDGELYWLIEPNSRGRRLKGKLAGTAKTTDSYRRIVYEGKNYLAHRIVWQLHKGSWPTMLDHINRDRTDNRIENLRETTKSLNGYNNAKRADPTKLPGVLYRHGRWGVWFYRGYHGSYETLLEAACVRRSLENNHGVH